jgi:hypothetical protein
MLNNVFECTECKSTQETLEDYSMQRCLVVGCEGVYNERFTYLTEPPPQYIEIQRMQTWREGFKIALMDISENEGDLYQALSGSLPKQLADYMLCQFDKTFNINQNP